MKQSVFFFTTEQLFTYIIVTFLQDEPTMFPLIVFLMIEATLKYGINASSCDALSSFALLCGPFYFRRPREERKMLHALDLILSKPGMERSKARSIYINEGVIRKLLLFLLVHKHLSYNDTHP